MGRTRNGSVVPVAAARTLLVAPYMQSKSSRRARSSKTRPSAPSGARPRANATPPGRRWSGQVTARSDALDLEEGVFQKPTSAAVAASLKRSADRSRRRKGTPFRSAMSMLTFFINRAGANLSSDRRRVLEGAKEELRRLYHRAGRAAATKHV